MPNYLQARMIVQKLLAERFGLQFHEEKRKVAAYGLVVSKDGPKMTKAAGASSSPKVLLYPQGVLVAQSVTMADLAQYLRSIFWPAGGGQNGTRRGAVGLHDEVDAG